MSENEENKAPAAEPTVQESSLAQAVKESIPQPPKVFAYNDLHTASNTPMKQLLDNADEFKRLLSDKDREKGFVSIFTGNTKAVYEAGNELISHWTNWASVAELATRERVDSSIINKSNSDWEQYVDTHFPGRSLDEIQNLAKDLFVFYRDIHDDLLGRTRVVHEEDVSNVSQRSGKHVTGDILGRVPAPTAKKGMSISETMARTSAGASKTPFEYHVLVRNAFLALTFSRPDPLDIANLINDINRRIGLYVRQVGGNTLTLSYIAGVVEVWKFLKARIISCSVTGLVDFGDLGKLLRFTDFQVLCSALLDSISDEGVQMDLRCIFQGCDHSKFGLIDPTRLVRVRHSIQTDEEAAIFGNIFSGKVTYTFDETLAMIEQSTYGLAEEDFYVYNADQTVRLKVGPPSIYDAIETFEFFVGQVEPRMKEIRNKVDDQQAASDQLMILLNSLGGSEMIHWVTEYAYFPGGIQDENAVILKRSESQNDEFNKGLMAAMRNKTMNHGLIQTVYRKTPFMSRTFVGIRNFDCPKCGKNSAEAQEIVKLGYTPIDAYMHFFTQSQIITMNLAVEGQSATREARS